MVALALGNFGLYQLRLPSVLVQAAGRAGEGAFGAFFMGLTMGVVGAPCIGPIVAALLLYVGAHAVGVRSASRSSSRSGSGMGLPYVALRGRCRPAATAAAQRRLARLGGAALRLRAARSGAPLRHAAARARGWCGCCGRRSSWSRGVVLGFLGVVAGEPVGYRWGRRLAGVAAIVVGLSGLLVAEAESPDRLGAVLRAGPGACHREPAGRC